MDSPFTPPSSPRGAFSDDEGDGEFPFSLEGLELPIIYYIRTIKEENNDIKRQLNAVLEHEANLWESNMSLERTNSDLMHLNTELTKELAQANDAGKSLEDKTYLLWEMNVKMEEKNDELEKERKKLAEELEGYKESNKSLEDKTYVMNSILDDLVNACNSLYDNLQTLLQDKGRHYSYLTEDTFADAMLALRSTRMFGLEKIEEESSSSGGGGSGSGTPRGSGSKRNSGSGKSILRMAQGGPKKYDGDVKHMKILSKRLKACADISAVLRKHMRLTA